jgi:hypothetical protein
MEQSAASHGDGKTQGPAHPPGQFALPVLPLSSYRFEFSAHMIAMADLPLLHAGDGARYTTDAPVVANAPLPGGASNPVESIDLPAMVLCFASGVVLLGFARDRGRG